MGEIRLGVNMEFVRHDDKSFEWADAERGQVSGTPVGCACGEGVTDRGDGQRAGDGRSDEVVGGG